ncbi:MAG: SLC13 family permease [Acidobacteriota bacterium]
MSIAWISLIALMTAVTLSMFTKVNVGIVSIAFAWVVGVYLGGLPLNTVIGGFPVQLFFTLVGVTLLFGMAHVNGTLERLAARAVSLCRGNTGIVPVMFFFVALFLATIGPGNIATAALLAPMAMAIGHRAGVPPFLMIIMVGNGAQAGALSPFAPTGVIVNGVMERIGLGGVEWQTYVNNLLAHLVITFTAYFVFGGWRLFSQRDATAQAPEDVQTEPFERHHWITMGVLATLVIVVIFFDMQVGMAALTGATFLSLIRAADEKETIRRMPWSVVLMVCGVTVLIGVLERTQGMDLFTDLLARISTPATVTGVIAFVTGLVSVYSSTSGVVLPAFLPTVPGLVERLGGGDALAIASAMNVGGHLVDLSPLSTIGALCLAALPVPGDAPRVFNQLLAWGLSMTVVGGVICWVLF